VEEIAAALISTHTDVVDFKQGAYRIADRNVIINDSDRFASEISKVSASHCFQVATFSAEHSQRAPIAIRATSTLGERCGLSTGDAQDRCR
jgi:hypothetical protein